MDSKINFYRTTPHDCPYLDAQQSSNFVIDPEYPMSSNAYDYLLESGFRRSADFVYRPACPECSECKSSRVRVNEFTPNRSQKRAWKKVSADLVIKPCSDEFKQQHFELYQHYVDSRHTDSNMANSSIEQYMGFLTSSWSDTIFLEIRVKNELLAVAVTDRQPNSLSALYTFYDPEKMHYSPGVVAILSQIELARKNSLDWLYLGYWIESCQKMSYKTRYQPVEVMDNGHWQML